MINIYNMKHPISDEDYYRTLVKSRCKFFEDLNKFSEERSLLEKDFPEKLKSSFHSVFWELYLPYYLNQHKIQLERGGSRQGESTDFCFESGGKKVWMEAVCCGAPAQANQTQIDEDAWTSGLVAQRAKKIIPRLTQAIQSKEKKYKLIYSKVIRQEDSYVIALNGYRSRINNSDMDHRHTRVPPSIIQTLFGIIDPAQDKRTEKMFFPLLKTIDKQAKGNLPTPISIGFFNDAKYKHISGILFSTLDITEAAVLNKHQGKSNFSFIQNPFAPDITDIFSFCRDQAGVWVVEGDKIKCL